MNVRDVLPVKFNIYLTYIKMINRYAIHYKLHTPFLDVAGLQ